MESSARKMEAIVILCDPIAAFLSHAAVLGFGRGATDDSYLDAEYMTSKERAEYMDKMMRDYVGHGIN